MGFFLDLFSKPVTSKELRVALEGLEKKRRQLQLDMRKMSLRQNKLIDKAKKARADRREDELDWLWQEIKHIKLEITVLRRETKRVNLESIGVKRYLWGLERLEKENNKEGIRSLLNRIRKSRLDIKLAGQEIKEREYMEELNMTLENAGFSLDMMEDMMEEEDPMKDKFLGEIDSILDAEKSGDPEEAKKREERLKLRLEELDEDEFLVDDEEDAEKEEKEAEL